METFKRIIQKTQANFLLNRVPNSGKKVQGSYNLPIGLKAYLLEHNAIEVNNSKGDEHHVVYNITSEWQFVLGESIFEIIGDSFKTVENKIIFVFTQDRDGQSAKIQLIRSFFEKMNSPEYKWFIDLYDNNFVGAEFSVLVNENKKILKIDNKIISKQLISMNDNNESAYQEILENIEDFDKFLEDSPIRDGKNEIYYGPPGCGKSYYVKQKHENGSNIVLRTTFHPEYSNSDFVGQITPIVDDNNNVIYEFNPGIFTISLIKALDNLENKVVLIIEEINRGNASSIFGDIFQLLDRDAKGKSIYPVNNERLVSYINKNIKGTISNIFIPSNLTIVATMNTSDQNISPLDTAFKRRWNLIKIKNVFEENNELARLFVPMTNLTWQDFIEKINKYIIDNSEQLNIFGEDKCLGVYFVGKNELSNIPDDETEDGAKANKLFSEKVLFYIWNDIAKLSPLLWFKPEYKTFDSIIDGFEKNGLDIFIGSIFG